VKAPVQLWEAEDDRRAPNRWNADIVKANLPSPPEVHLVPRADHFAFLAPCNAALSRLAPQVCTEIPGFDRTAFHRDFNAAVIAFFRKQLDSR
jgi:predicted dienelactone hydrolase